MKICTYFIGFNIADTIHLTIKHYQQFGDVVYYDNFSDDNSRDIAQKMGATVIQFGTPGVLDDQEYITAASAHRAGHHLQNSGLRYVFR